MGENVSKGEGHGYCPWEDLPATALVIIFKKLPLKDRFCGGPLVCRSWREASNSPQCWESMLPDYHGGACSYNHHSFEDLFIRQKRSKEFNSNLFGEFSVTLKVVEMFVERSKGNSITIYLPLANQKDATFLLNFVTLRCPKLKNLSMRSTDKKFWPYQVVAGLVSSLDACKELELLDLGIPFRIPAVPNPHQIISLSPKIRGLRALCVGEPDWLQNFGDVFYMNWGSMQHLNLEMTKLGSSKELELILDRFRNLTSLRAGTRPSSTSTKDELMEKCDRILQDYYLRGSDMK